MGACCFYSLCVSFQVSSATPGIVTDTAGRSWPCFSLRLESSQSLSRAAGDAARSLLLAFHLRHHACTHSCTPSCMHSCMSLRRIWHQQLHARCPAKCRERAKTDLFRIRRSSGIQSPFATLTYGQEISSLKEGQHAPHQHHPRYQASPSTAASPLAQTQSAPSPRTQSWPPRPAP